MFQAGRGDVCSRAHQQRWRRSVAGANRPRAATDGAAGGDHRQAGKVTQELLTLVRQRTCGIAAGYDAAQLADDPMLKLARARAPLSGPALASQPTLSWFENAVRPRTLLRIGEEIARTVLAHQQRRRRHRLPRRMIIDINPIYGQQEFSVFNGFDGTSCYLPLVVTVSFDQEAEKFLVASVRRPGNAAAMRGTLGSLRRLMALLWKYFPKAQLRLRAASALAVSELLGCLEAGGIEYVIAIASNSVLASIQLLQ